jgi:hypothetical protein
MARRSSIDSLPEDVRRWLDRALSSRGFAQYQLLEQAMREKGYSVSKSAINRYGQKLERRLAAIRASTEAAKILTEASPDGQDARSEALVALVQTELFETIINLQEATDEEVDAGERVKMLSNAAKNIATLTRSSVNLKRFQAEVRKEFAAQAQAMLDDAVKAASKAGEKGLSGTRLQQLKLELAGMA